MESSTVTMTVGSEGEADGNLKKEEIENDVLLNLSNDSPDHILDVAYQLKEKLVVKSSPLAVNGHVLIKENGIPNFVEKSSNSVQNHELTVNDHDASHETNPDRTIPSSDDDLETNKCPIHVNPVSSSDITYVGYESELQMPDIMRLIQKDLSEPYSIYTYRYFIHNWPKLCFLAMHETKCVGAVVCKLDLHKKTVRRGYIAMLAVDENYRKQKIGTNLVLKAIKAMVADDADEIVLETEITNKPALQLYENLGFVRDKRLFRYYLNGVDALRLKLWLQ